MLRMTSLFWGDRENRPRPTLPRCSDARGPPRACLSYMESPRGGHSGDREKCMPENRNLELGIIPLFSFCGVERTLLPFSF